MTLIEITLEKILESTNITIGGLFPILYENDILLPAWIYQRVAIWWLEYNRRSILQVFWKDGMLTAQNARYLFRQKYMRDQYSILSLSVMGVSRKCYYEPYQYAISDNAYERQLKRGWNALIGQED